MSVKIADLLKTDLTDVRRWLTWESEDYPGIAFEVELVPISRAEFKRMVSRHTKEVFNRAVRSHIERVDNEGAGNEVVMQAVKNWRGLTIKKLSELTLLKSGDEAIDLDTEIEFSEENLKAILEALPEFGGWVIQTATHVKNFDEAELKNS